MRSSNRRTAKPPSKLVARVATQDDAAGSRSVRRAFDILELILRRGEPVTVTQMVTALAIPKSTTYELVRTLASANYLAPATRGSGLFLGRKLYELGMAYRSQADLLRDGSQVVEELRNETGETVQLSVLDDGLMMVLLKEEGIRPLRIISNVGSRVPVNWAASGRLLVSDLEDDALSTLLASKTRQSPTGKATTDIRKLINQIRRFRRQGYAIELNEANEHAGCIAAPVLDTSGRCVAALSVVVPEQRLTKPDRQQLIGRVVAAAAKLSSRIG